MISIISILVEDILQAFRLPQSQQQIQLQPLLRKLKILLEGQYQPTNSARTPRSGNNILGGPSGLRLGKSKLSQLQAQDEQSRLGESMLSLPTGPVKE